MDVGSVGALLVSAAGAGAACLAAAAAWRQAGGQDRGSTPRPPAEPAGMPVGVPVGQLPGHVRGRDRLLGELRRARHRLSVCYPVVLTGTGGVGKSTVAAAFAERTQRGRLRRPFVWWVSAADPASLIGALVTVARRLGGSFADLEAIGSGATDAPDRLWALLERARRRWLLVFDNADDPAVLACRTACPGSARSPAGGAGWVRPARHGLIVVTSRNANQSAWGGQARLLPVGPLDVGAAAQVLRDRAPEAGGEDEARSLARRLGGMPLALHLAGSYLGSGVASLASFREFHRAFGGGRANSLLLASALDADSAATARTDVMRTWEMSLDALALDGTPQARPLLRLLSCFAPATPIPFELLSPRLLAPLLAATSGVSRSASGHGPRHGFERGLHQLALFGLVDIRHHRTPAGAVAAEGRAIVVHPVIAETNRVHLDRDPLGALVRNTAVDLMAAATAALRHDVVADWPQYMTLNPHLHAMLEAVAGGVDSEHLCRLRTVIAIASNAYGECGAVSASELLLRETLKVTDTSDDDDPAVLQIRHHLAWPIALLGRPAEAETVYRDVLAARRRILGDQHLDTVRTRHELAWVTAVQGRWAEAEASYRDVLDARRRLLGETHGDTLITHHELGWAIARQGRLAEAERILHDVLNLREQLLEAEHPRILKTQLDLAWLAAMQGQWARAEDLYRNLLAVRRRIIGEEHPDTLDTRFELGWVRASQGDRSTALREYRALVEMYRRILGGGSQRTLAVRQALEHLQRGVVVQVNHLA